MTETYNFLGIFFSVPIVVPNSAGHFTVEQERKTTHCLHNISKVISALMQSSIFQWGSLQKWFPTAVVNTVRHRSVTKWICWWKFLFFIFPWNEELDEGSWWKFFLYATHTELLYPQASWWWTSDADSVVVWGQTNKRANSKAFKPCSVNGTDFKGVPLRHLSITGLIKKRSPSRLRSWKCVYFITKCSVIREKCVFGVILNLLDAIHVDREDRRALVRKEPLYPSGEIGWRVLIHH